MHPKKKFDTNSHTSEIDDLALEAAGLAYREQLFKEFEEIENDPDARDLSAGKIQQLDHNIMKGFREIHSREKGKVRRRRIVQVAACIAAIVILLPTVVFQVDAARSEIANYLISSFSQFAEIQYDSSDNAKPPLGWTSPYYPTWLPEKSTIIKVLMESQGDFVWYQDEEGYTFQFAVIKDVAHRPSFNEENMMSEKREIKEHEATLFYTMDRCTHYLVIPLTDAVVIISGNLSEDQIIKIGENIKNF